MKQNNLKYISLTNKNIIIAAGGTGGHIYPALTVADLLLKNNANVTWVGTPKSMEAKIVPKIFNIQYIKSSGIRGKGFIKKLTFPIKLIISILKAGLMLKKLDADLVIGFGGYASGATCLAAIQKNIPVIIHEQNAKIGLTNRILARFANRICLAFDIDNLKDHLSSRQLKKVKIVGNPVRKSIAILNTQKKDFSGTGLKLLILGGSQGAKAINDIIPSLVKQAKKQGIDIKIWHQTGKLSFKETKNRYKDIPNEHIQDISPFIFDIAVAYSWADLVISRAGALTVSECAIAGLPAIFIPFSFAVDDHQFCNAQSIVKNNASFCLREDQMTLENLIDIMKPLVEDKTQLKKMSEITKRILIKNSSQQILNCVKELFTAKKT